MKFLDLSFIKQEMIKPYKKKLVLNIKPKFFDIPIKVLDTNTGSIHTITYKELVERPIKPFYRINNVLGITDNYHFKDITGKVLKFFTIAFYVETNCLIIWIDRKVYYKPIYYDDRTLISGFSMLKDMSAISYYYPIRTRGYYNVSNLVLFREATFWFNIEISAMQQIECNISLDMFSCNIKIYLTKLKLLGYIK